ncbi:ER membrane protein complex subunit 4, partial [Chiloscyllium plagiosum]|uniref:ER membrane protein complex subunit 4 n=1 Tax=Chiloscyllium plagiosum TaxID=36176 RepID=UPI001CB84527
MSHQEVRDHVAHTVERFRKDKVKLCEQQEEVQRKLVQMQLEELIKKEKEKAKKVFPVRTDTVINTSVSQVLVQGGVLSVHVTTQQLVVISATPGRAYSSDGTSPLYYYDLTTVTVQGICPYGDVDDKTIRHKSGMFTPTVFFLFSPRSRDRQCGQGDSVYPVGYSEKQLPDTSVQETDRILVEKRCWDIALGPLKQVPMNLFIMYMAGNTISIFPIMMVCMMAWRPIQALMSMSASEYRTQICGIEARQCTDTSLRERGLRDTSQCTDISLRERGLRD